MHDNSLTNQFEGNNWCSMIKEQKVIHEQNMMKHWHELYSDYMQGPIYNSLVDHARKNIRDQYKQILGHEIPFSKPPCRSECIRFLANEYHLEYM